MFLLLRKMAPMIRTRLITLSCLGFSILTLALSSCGKKTPPAAASTSATAAAVPAAQTAKASLADHAAKLGFAAHLPKETELYFGTANLKTQLDTAKKSAFWKDVSAFIDDKTPKPGNAANPSAEAMKKLWGDDFFIAFAKGTTPTLSSIREFSELYTEITYRAMMAGGPLGGGAAAATKAPDKIAQAFLGDARLLKSAASMIF